MGCTNFARRMGCTVQIVGCKVKNVGCSLKIATCAETLVIRVDTPRELYTNDKFWYGYFNTYLYGHFAPNWHPPQTFGQKLFGAPS